jgi:hypothetical protein
MADVEVKLYLDHVRSVVEGATDEVLKKLAFRTLEGAQLNIRENNQIDTGFMVNSGYVVFQDGSTYDQARGGAETRTTDREGRHVDHSGDMGPEEQLPSDAAAGVVFGANYAIYQEAANPYLYPAAEKAAAEFGGEAEKIYRDVLPDEGPGEH